MHAASSAFLDDVRQRFQFARFPDAGFNGAVITLGAGFAKCAFDAESGVFTFGAGLRLSQAVREAAFLGRSDLEFAVGIPGTVGGAVRMNAGTRREFLGPRIVSVTTLRPGGGLRRYAARDIEWNYRETFIPFDEVVLECEVATTEGSEQEIRRAMQKSQERRRTRSLWACLRAEAFSATPKANLLAA